MAFKQCLGQKSNPVPMEMTGAENLNGCFDCHICFDYACDPVVTLCGHLYCWACIYKWFHVQSASLAPDEYPRCPVCKAEISHTTVVPLYGRGQMPVEAEHQGKTCVKDGAMMPPRPPACGTRALLNAASHPSFRLPNRNPYQGHRYFPEPSGTSEEVASSPLIVNPGGSSVPRVLHQVAEMVEDILYARYPSSYNLTRSTSPRLRRQEMHADKFLGRISLFLVCCFFLCLLLF